MKANKSQPSKETKSLKRYHKQKFHKKIITKPFKYSLCNVLSLNKVLLRYDKLVCEFLSQHNSNKSYRKINYLKYFISNNKRQQRSNDPLKMLDYHRPLPYYSLEKQSEFQRSASTACESSGSEQLLCDFDLAISKKSNKTLSDFELNHNSDNVFKKQLIDFEFQSGSNNNSSKVQSESVMSNEAAPKMITEDAQSEDIYQQIWKCHTIGDVIDDDDQVYAYEPIEQSNEIDAQHWEVAEEFKYSTHNDGGDQENLKEHEKTKVIMPLKQSSNNLKTVYSPFRRIHILYNTENVKLNKIIYNEAQLMHLNNQLNCESTNIRNSHNESKEERNSVSNKSALVVHPISCETTSTEAVKSEPKKYVPIPGSVQAWKYMLLSVNYMEDEEEMVRNYV